MMLGKSPAIRWHTPTIPCFPKPWSAGLYTYLAACYRVFLILFMKSMHVSLKIWRRNTQVMLSVNAACLSLKKVMCSRFAWRIWRLWVVSQSMVWHNCIRTCWWKVCSMISISCGLRNLTIKPMV